MARIFFALAFISFALMLVNLTLGFMIGDYGELARSRNAIRRELHEAKKTNKESTEHFRKQQYRLAEKEKEFQPAQARMALHFWVGVIATLFAVLINSVSVTYFIGTARWCKEVVETYSLDESLAEASSGLKRQAFPWALGSIVLTIFVAAMGGAADQAGSFGDSSANWVTPHYLIAIVSTCFIGWSYLVQVKTIAMNFDTIERILKEVSRIRERRLGQSIGDGVGQGGAVD